MQNEEDRRKMRQPRPILERTKDLALRIIRVYGALPKTTEAQVLRKQLLRSGTSVGAHCREGHRSRSKAEFVSKFNGALMELEEAGYWIELLVAAQLVPRSRVSGLLDEVNDLTAILVTIINNAKKTTKERR